MRLVPRGVILCILAVAFISALGLAEKAPLNLAIVWHQHQPMYWNRLTGEYELPWARIHGVQEYIDTAHISAEYPDIHVTFNLQPSLLWQLNDYATITPAEAALGGLYEHIGAIDNHLEWTWILATAPAQLSDEERTLAQEQFFWLNGYMFDDDTNDPYYDSHYAELNMLANAADLSDQQLLDAAALFLLWQTSPELHEEYGLLGYRNHAGFTTDDIIVLLQAQMAILQEVVVAYQEIVPLGNELITSPFYHPIMPLLIENGWADDVLGQLQAGQDQHQQLFGESAVGVWSPEQAVSEEAVSLLGQAGFQWTSTDEGLLAQALNHTPSLDELTTAYTWDGVTVMFRDTELSNKISFAYGNKPTASAVADFMSEMQNVWDALEDPADHVLTLAMDGENWMFLAGYPNNGRTFLRALYSAMTDADWIQTVTPSELLAAGIPSQPLPTVPIGSWAGDLSTWSGESDEDEGWARLATARAIVAEAGDPADAVEAIYAAQGSDWFWWYGTDQDSGTDDLFDWLFKAHLTGAYTLVGGAVPDVLGLRLIPPMIASLGEITPTIDGSLGEDEGWDEAVILVGSGTLREARLAYRETNLLVIVETSMDPATLIGEEGLSLTLYASGTPGTTANITTRHSGAQLGFELASAIQIRFDKIDADGSGIVSKYVANGSGGWRYASSIATANARVIQIDDHIEFSVPFSEAGLEPGKSTTLSLVLERPGEILAVIPAQPSLVGIPTLIQGVERYAMADPVGDDYGPGTYTYPLSDEIGAGVFDLVGYRVFDSDDRWQLAFDFAALTNEWGGPHGFSHPILYLYFDLSEGGSTESFDEAAAARVSLDTEHPWDVFIRVAGWPAYGRHLWTAAGEGPLLVEVASDPKRGRIIVTIPKSIMPEIEGWHYVLVGSQDGYGANYLRSIVATAADWVGGGNPDPFWSPQIYDYLAPSTTTQEEILSAYDNVLEHYATLLPVFIELGNP
jgi:alpha-amylase/alpha-mannosidase (GH57 family)